MESGNIFVSSTFHLINFVHLIPFRKTLCSSRRLKRVVNILRINEMDRVPKLKNV